jgi:hypothetical protein
MTKILMCALVLLSSLSAMAQSKVGTTGAPFLGIGVGTRAMAMGGAFSAMKDDATMLYWNPAAIARNVGVQASFVQANWLIGTRISWAGASVNFGDAGTFGASVNVLGSGDIERTTEAQDRGTGEFFSTFDASFQLSYARALTNQFSVGITTKFIAQSLYRTSTSTVAIDLGVLYDVTSRVRLAATISNFGGTLRPTGNGLLITTSTGTGQNGENNGIAAELSTDDWNLPLIYRVGLAAEIFNTAQNRLTVSADGVSPSDNQPHLNIGAEYAWRELLYFRGGYNSLFKPEAEEGYTLGVGLRAPITKFVVKVDYAYQSFGRLNAPQWLSVGLVF